MINIIETITIMNNPNNAMNGMCSNAMPFDGRRSTVERLSFSFESSNIEKKKILLTSMPNEQRQMFDEDLLKELRESCTNNSFDRFEALVKKLRKHPRYWSRVEWSETTDAQNRSLLHYCCFSSKPDILRTFIIWGAADHDVVNDVNMLGQSPLHVAATANDIESAKLLLDAGSSVHVLDSAGFNPAHVAARWGNAEMLQLFLSRGTDVERKTKLGKTLIEVCNEYNHGPIVRNVILATPNPPLDIRLKWSTQNFEMYVSWENSEAVRGTAIDRYDVQIRDEQDDGDWCVPSTNDIYDTSTTFGLSNVLRPARIYRVRVRAHNMGGWSKWCESSESISTCERSLEIKILNKRVHVMKTFRVRISVQGRPPCRGSWIGIFPMSSSRHSKKDAKRCVYDINEIISSSSTKKNHFDFTWKADRGFPTDGKYRFCYFDREESTTPSWCSDIVTVHTSEDEASPKYIMQHLYDTRNQSKERVSCADNVVVPCHAWVLSLRSPVLYAMLYECSEQDKVNDANVRYFSLKASRRGGIVLDLPEISPDVFRAFLRWAYLNEIDSLEDDVADGLLCFADRFDVLGLYVCLRAQVSESLNPDRAIRLLMMSYDDCEGDAFRVRDIVSRYVRCHGRDVASSSAFESVQDEESLRRVERSLRCYDEEEAMWMYKDEIDAEHGPFKGVQLRRWVEMERLSSDLRVRSVTRNMFEPLSSTQILRDDVVVDGDDSHITKEEKIVDNIEREFENALRRDFFPNFYFETKRDGVRRYVSKFFLHHRSCGLRSCLMENQESHGVVLNLSLKLLDLLLHFIYTGNVDLNKCTALECVSLLPFTFQFSLPILARRVHEKLTRLDVSISSNDLVQCFRNVCSLLPFYENVWKILVNQIEKDNADEIFEILSESKTPNALRGVLKRCKLCITSEQEQKTENKGTLGSIVRHLKSLKHPDINSKDLNTVLKYVQQSKSNSISLLFISNCLPIVRKLLRDEKNVDIVLSLDDPRAVLILLTLAMLVRRSPDKKILGDRFVDWLWFRFDRAVLEQEEEEEDASSSSCSSSPALLKSLDDLKRVPYWVHEKDIEYLRTIATEHILSKPGLCDSKLLTFSLKKYLLSYRMRVRSSS